MTTARSTPQHGFNSKIACVVIPNFSIEVYLRNTLFNNSPLALVNPGARGRTPTTGDSTAINKNETLDLAEIIAINQKAIDAGVLLNITVTQGHILCPNLTVRVKDTEKEIEQSNAIYKKLQSLSPFVEESRPGLYFLDASGLDLLYQSDQQFAAEIIKAIKSYGRPPYGCRIGIGGNKFVAQVAANLSRNNRFTLVPLGSEGKFLQPLPLAQLQTDVLRLSSGTLESLRDLGLNTIGQAAAFPANEMIRRFGPQGEILSQLARGNDTAFFMPESPTEPLTRTIWFDNPVDRIETISHQVALALPSLLAELGRYSRGCSTIDVIFHLDDRKKSAMPLSIFVERPTLSTEMFLRQLRTSLAGQKLTAPVTGLTVTIPVAAALLSEQLPLADRFTTGANYTSDLPELPAITTPVRRDLFLPEQRFVLSEPASRPEHENYARRSVWSDYCPYSSSAPVGLRLHQPPRRIKVAAEKEKPVAINQTPVTGQGPWKLSGHWWSRDYDRHYWEVRTTGRRHYLVYHDRQIDRWFLQGVFD